MKKFLQKTTLTLAALTVASSVALAALTIDGAKQSGLVGERADGLLGVVGNPTPDVQTLVDSINAERLEKYRAIAAKNGTQLNQVQALAGKKLIEGAAPGQFIQNGAGGWQKK